MTHGCAYCNKGNRDAAKRAGVTAEQLARIMDEGAPCFDARERAVLRLADQIVLTNMHGELTPALMAQLRPHFDDAQVFELGMVAGILTGMAKFIFVYDLVEKEANCPIVPLEQDAA
jgi:alkylhydroperoxidase family enzyme